MTVDKENEDPMPGNTEKSRNPSKSILKDNTVPIPSNKRRVSFAPEVTLHKFDFLPVDNDSKRRRTIGNIPGESVLSRETEANEEIDDGGLDMLSDSSDDDSFSKIEIQTNLIVDELNTLNRENKERNKVIEVNDEENEEGKKDNDNGEVENKESGIKSNVIESVIENDSDDNDDNEEQTMELTGQIPTVPMNREHIISTVVEQLSSSDEDDDEVDMELTGTQKVQNFQNIPRLNEAAKLPSLNEYPVEAGIESSENNEIEQDNGNENNAKKSEIIEKTADHTDKIIYTNLDQLDDVSMDITKIWSVTKTNVVQEESVFEELAKNDQNPDFVDKSNSDINDKLQLLSINKSPNQNNFHGASDEVDNINEEQTMDLTLIKTQIKTPLNRNDEEETMDLTQTSSVRKPVVEEEQSMDITQTIASSKQAEKPEEEQTMDLTQVSSVVVPVKPKELPVRVLEKVVEEESINTEAIVEKNEDFGSQPMQLTQEDQVLVRKSSSPQSVADISREEVVTTTLVPLVNADESKDVSEIAEDEDDDYIPVKLNEFMNDIGVKFYDDLDIDIYLTKRLSLTNGSLDEENFGLKDYIKAYPKLELLSLYQFSCEELNKNIQEGKKVFAEYNETIESNNPALFKEYYSSDYHERSNLNVKLQLIKDYTRHQSKITWYDWRTQLVSNLIQELDIKYQSLVEDRDSFIYEIDQIDKILDVAKQMFQNLKVKLSNLLRFKEQLSGVDSGRLETMKNELQGVTKEIVGYKERLERKQSELAELDNCLKKNQEIKCGLMREISELEATLNNTRRYELEEIKVLNLKFKILETLGNLKFKSSESGLRFLYDGVVDVRVDLENQLKTEVSLVQSQTRVFNSWLLERFGPKIIKLINFSNTIEGFKRFKSVWKQFKNLDRDIHLMSLKYPISEGKTNDFIEFSIRYFNFEHKYKMALNFSLPVENIENYANKISVEGKLLRNENQIEKSSIQEHIKKDFLFVKLVDQVSIGYDEGI